MDLLHVKWIQIHCVPYGCLHYSRLNENVPSLSQEGKMSAVAKLEGAVRGGSVQGANVLHSSVSRICHVELVNIDFVLTWIHSATSTFLKWLQSDLKVVACGVKNTHATRWQDAVGEFEVILATSTTWPASRTSDRNCRRRRPQR